MSDQDQTPPWDNMVRDVSTLRTDLANVIVHLVPFLKANQGIADLQKRIDILERQKAARSERPMISGIAETLALVRHTDIDPGVSEVLADSLVRTLRRGGCAEFGKPGEPFDPARHEVIGGAPGTGDVISAIHARGVECCGEVLVRAKVQLAPPLANNYDNTIGAAQ